METVASKPNGDGKDTTIVSPNTKPIPIYSIEPVKHILQGYKPNLEDILLETTDT